MSRLAVVVAAALLAGSLTGTAGADPPRAEPPEAVPWSGSQPASRLLSPGPGATPDRGFGPSPEPHRQAKQLKASSGSVSATVTWNPADGGLSARSVRLVIVRAGVPALDDDVRIDRRKTVDIPVALRVLDLAGDGEPEVVLDLYTGGAHCCTVSLVERFDLASSTYLPTTHNWGDPGYRLENLDHTGVPELVTGDYRFAYAFSCYACSALPVQVWRFETSGFVNVTREFPGLVRKDAAAVWKDYRAAARRDEDVRGLLSAWAADRALLGKGAEAFRALGRLTARGVLNGDAPWASGRRYVRELRTFLKRTGYL